MPANVLADGGRKARAAAMLARGLPAEHVGRQLDVTGRTVRRWLEDPAYAEQVQELRRTALGKPSARWRPSAGPRSASSAGSSPTTPRRSPSG